MGICEENEGTKGVSLSKNMYDRSQAEVLLNPPPCSETDMPCTLESQDDSNLFLISLDLLYKFPFIIS